VEIPFLTGSPFFYAFPPPFFSWRAFSPWGSPEIFGLPLPPPPFYVYFLFFFFPARILPFRARYFPFFFPLRQRITFFFLHLFFSVGPTFPSLRLRTISRFFTFFSRRENFFPFEFCFLVSFGSLFSLPFIGLFFFSFRRDGTFPFSRFSYHSLPPPAFLWEGFFSEPKAPFSPLYHQSPPPSPLSTDYPPFLLGLYGGPRTGKGPPSPLRLFDAPVPLKRFLPLRGSFPPPPCLYFPPPADYVRAPHPFSGRLTFFKEFPLFFFFFFFFPPPVLLPPRDFPSFDSLGGFFPFPFSLRRRRFPLFPPMEGRPLPSFFPVDSPSRF